MKPYEGRNQPQSWLHDLDDTIASGPLNNSLDPQLDLMQTSENSNSVPNENAVTLENEDLISQDISIQTSENYNSVPNENSVTFGNEDHISQEISAAQGREIDKSQNPTQSTRPHIPGIPIIRTRRERVVKPRQRWSPS